MTNSSKEELRERLERVCDKYMKHTARPNIVASALMRQVIDPEIAKLKAEVERMGKALSQTLIATSHLKAIRDITDEHVEKWCNDADRFIVKALQGEGA